MKPEERWEDVQRIFEGARKLADEKRGAYLDEACDGDGDLRHEVQSILDAYHAADDSFIQPPSADETLEQVGPYKILGVVGEGGMGTVYAAEQTEPLRRKVALKVIKLGMDTNEVLARFEAEHGALNVLDHPNIARVYDAGKTPSGRPYFVMEYVPGIPVTQFCDRERLDTASRLDLFLAICDGVQHAHRKGIIHRDLKPSNILITHQDEKPVPKIVDFGVAKAMDHRLTERTLFTEVGQMIGTPEYMSPEQAGVTGADVDTRTDVYSLGVLLYELLTGVLPFDANELRSEGYARIQHIIQEVDPPKPSTRLSTIGDDTEQMAKRHGTDRRSLIRRLRGELDWIVMRALEKSRARRYESVTALANDIQRHIRHEPVLAGPPSRVYRVRKFVRKNRGLVTATTAVFLALLLGLIGTYSEYRKTQASEKREKEQREIAEDRFEEIVRLSDMKRMEDCHSKAETLWPAHPQNIEGMKDWLENAARPLASRLPKHEETLVRLQSGALYYDQEQRKLDTETHPRLADLERAKVGLGWLRDQIESTEDPEHREDLERQRAETEQEIERFAAEIRERRTWKFIDAETQWQHDSLHELVKDLRAFADAESGAIVEMEHRLRFAESIESLTVSGDEARAAWEEAIEDIARLPVYGGLEVSPQLGLFPLGLNPDSGLWEFWHVQTGDRPQPNDRSQKFGPWLMNEESGVVFVLIPPGRFHMGAQKDSESSPGHDPDASDDEAPVHEVALDAFFISKYEMTQGQWRRFTGTNPSYYAAGKDILGNMHTEKNPVEQVSWNDCMKQLRRLGLEIPTEAQWEYAARAGTTTPWWCGATKKDVPDAEAGNFADAWTRDNGGPPWGFEDWEDGWAAHAPVGTFAPNPWGIHDVIGNLWEWCRDNYGPYHFEVRDGDGERRVPDASQRVLRSGAFLNRIHIGSASREFAVPDLVDQAIGIRPSRPIHD